MLRPVDLIRLSLEIENRVAANSDLPPLPGKDAALLMVGLHRDGCLIPFR